MTLYLLDTNTFSAFMRDDPRATKRLSGLGADDAVFYARLKSEAERAGTPLDENDLWIAASAQATGAVLVTADSDFAKIAHLDVENWTT